MLSLAKKAGKLVFGFDAVCEAIYRETLVPPHQGAGGLVPPHQGGGPKGRGEF